MSVDTEEMTAAKPRKRPAAKAHTRPAADKVKVSIVLSSDVDFRLSVAAAALRMDRSALVNQILAESPTVRRFVVQDRAKPAGEATGDISA
jgi:predicted transcriptional regulator